MKASEAIMALMDKDVKADDLGTILMEHGIDTGKLSDDELDAMDLEDVSWLDTLPNVPSAKEKAKAELIANNEDKVKSFDDAAAGTNAVPLLLEAINTLSMVEFNELMDQLKQTGKMPGLKETAADLVSEDTRKDHIENIKKPFEKGGMPKDEGNRNRSKNILDGLRRRK